ncbi:MAG: YceH family protein [Terracidiphilus sp.]|jgi:uncharacterized protein YceH (UPF0502 family)
MLPLDETPPNQIVLSAAQARVLGALVEKEVTTPDYYPLSLNALINACNQRSNREPVMDLDEEDVRHALHRLEDLRLAGRARGADGRVTKYEHWLGEFFNFSRAETALVCVLLLRGPQTPGELRGRTERMHRFDELTDVLAALQKLMEREPPLAAVLPRLPGTKESRYAHLLSGGVEAVSAAENALGRRSPLQNGEADAGLNAGHEERIARLEAIIVELRQEMAILRQRIDDLFGDG